MKKTLVLLITFFLVNVTTFAGFEDYTSFHQLDSLSVKYLQKGNLDSAVLVMEHALKEFPEHDKKATFILSFLYVHAGEYQKAYANWEYGLEKHYFYGLNNWQMKERFKNDSIYAKLSLIDKQIGDSLDYISHIEHKVILPENYNKNKQYPVLFVFHGNGRNMEKASEVWNAEIMKDSFITVFVQSYSHQNSFNFRWKTNDVKTNKEFKAIYKQILTEYAIDREKIILAGMSAGGMTVINYAFSDFVPFSAVVTNCPVIPENIDNETVNKFVRNDKKIVIITGENDFTLESQKELILKIREAGGKSKIIINRGIGHQFANDFQNELNKYLTWALE